MKLGDFLTAETKQKLNVKDTISKIDSLKISYDKCLKNIKRTKLKIAKAKYYKKRNLVARLQQQEETLSRLILKLNK